MSAIPPNLGYLRAIWDPEKRTFHDKIAGTLVIRTADLPARSPRTWCLVRRYRRSRHVNVTHQRPACPVARSYQPMPAAPAPGDAAPSLQLPDLNGTQTSLRDLQGRPVLVSFLRHAG